MELEEKKYLTLLFILPILVVIFLLYKFWKRKKQKEFGEQVLLNRLSTEKSTFKPLLKFITIILAIIALVLALANPRIGTRIETVKREGIDIVFAIDVSKSMLAEDVAPNRLEKSKQLVSQIINSLGADRVGIVAYAGTALPLLPITTDYGAAKMFLQQLNTDMLSSQGTAISQAITLSNTYFDDSDTNKLLVLISDGEDHESGLTEAMLKAKENGMRILTIGVGTEKGSPIPIKVNRTTETYLRDNNNDVVITKLYPQTLQDIAKESDGSYVLGNNSKQVTDHFKALIDTIEKTQFESQEIAEYDSKFQWFIAVALFLLLADSFFFERKTAWVKKLNLFNEKK
jgi:Ca-activated chloride channel family protein